MTDRRITSSRLLDSQKRDPPEKGTLHSASSPHDALEINLHFGGGGTPVIPIGVGVELAFQHAGLRPNMPKEPGKPRLNIVSGNSGGAMVAMPWCAGLDAAELAPMAIEKNFRRLLKLRGHWWDVLRAELMRKVYERTMPPEGVFGTAKLGQYFENLVPTIPPNYYAVATWPKEKLNAPVVITAEGCYLGRELNEDGSWIYELVDPRPLSVAQTIRCTGALPGILESIHVEIGGQQMELVDGGLVAGANMIGPMLDIYKQPRSSIIVVDSSARGQEGKPLEWLVEAAQEFLYALLCEWCYMPKNSVESTAGCRHITPEWRFGSIEFGKGPWPKLLTLIYGYKAAFETLDSMGVIEPAARLRMQAVLDGIANCIKYSFGQSQDRRARRMIAFLIDMRMYKKPA